MKHLLTFDIEHWYESWRQRGLPFDRTLPDCDTDCVFHLLDLLDVKDQKATFFFTGNFAEEFPQLARECVKRGHEVASHSHDHSLLGTFKDGEAFQRNLTRSLDQIEKACGVRPIGFRAPKWTLTKRNIRDFLPEMIKAGLKYDSSVFPRSLTAFPDRPCRLVTAEGEIVEIPAGSGRLGPFHIPVGGAWFRLFPLTLTSCIFAKWDKDGQSCLFYAHPYDLNPESHCPAGTPIKLRLIRRLNVKQALGKLEKFLERYKFTSIRDWLKTAKISDSMPLEAIS